MTFMSGVTLVAFQIDNSNLAAIDAAVHRGEFRSRADALRVAAQELLDRRREALIDAQLEAGYAAVPEGPAGAAFAAVSRSSLDSADLAW